MSFMPRAQEIYKHFKGNLYQIVGIAEHTETGEKLVVYQALYGDFKIYARPLDMFLDRVDREKYPDAGQEFRFELQGPEGEKQRREREAAWQERPQAAEASGGKSGVGSRQEPPQAFGATEAKSGLASLQEPPQVLGPTEASGGKSGVGSRQESPQAFGATGAESGPEPQLDPMLLEFLDADTYEERLNILAGLHHRITQEMITTMAIACDVEVNEGDLEERYEALKTCLVTLERYECNRLR